MCEWRLCYVLTRVLSNLSIILCIEQKKFLTLPVIGFLYFIISFRKVMICFTSQSAQVAVVANFKFFNKNSRKVLSCSRYARYRFSLTRNSNTHLMFVRAPKHFKSGKQRVTFFNGIFRKRILFTTNAGYFLAVSPQPYFLYYLGRIAGIYNNKPDIILSRTTIDTTFYLKIQILWLVLYY